MKKVKIFGYVRVSTKAQASTGQSLDTQKTLITDYLRRQGWNVSPDQIEWISDAGISASKTRTANRYGWSKMMLGATKGSIVVASALDRVFRSVGDAALTLERLKAAGIELHTADKGCVTKGDAAANLQLNVLNSVAQFESELKSKRIKEVKTWMADNHMWMGGRRKRGFVKTKIGDKKFAVVDEGEKMALQWIAELKKKRDKEIEKLKSLRGHDTVRLPTGSNYTIEAIQQSIVEKGRKIGIQNLEKRFKRTTLFVLLGEDDENNVSARLAQLREVERKIYRVDGQFVLAKDLAGTSRTEGTVYGERQRSLLSAGLRSKQSVKKPIRTRVSSKRSV